MCYARRQRSSWARIKLSSKLYLNLSVKTLVSRACLALYTLLSMSWIRDRFKISFSKKFRDSQSQAFACTLISCCSIVNDPRGFLRYFSAAFFATWLLYHISFRLSRGFWKVFQFFCGIFCSQLAAVFVAARCQLAYYSTFVFICQAVFDNFFQFGDDSSMS